MRKVSILFLFILTLSSCAKIIMPVGGPKDVTPPSVVKEVPANGSTNFNSNTIKITFDEFVVLNNTLENVLISPQMAEQPTYTLNGKTLVIKLKDTLKPNQTYNIGFADCIHDYTEDNPIPFYNYAFSTGSHVDSFMLKGKVIDARTNAAVSNCFVFAYDQDVDSLPLTTRPQLVTKTQPNGTFAIHNIKEGSYKLFALKDINSNMIFDLPNEEIAFGEETFPSILMLPDSVKTDSTAAQIPAIKLRLFVEEDTIQSFSKMQNKEFGKYEFFYKNNITTVAAEAIRGTLPDRWEVIGSDTITWYCKEEVKDTVLFVMTVNGTACDTLELTPFKKREARGRRADKQDGGKLLITSSNTGELYKPLTLSFSYPIRPTENAQVQLIGKRKRAGNDTINIPVTVKDTFARSISIPTKLEEKVPYTLIITDSTFQGYNNLYNDSTVVNFTNRSAKDYGSIRMSFNLPTTSDFIVQLLNDKDRVLREDVLRGESELLYSNLLAGRYKLKVIEDRNGNGRWDTGKYNEKRQPERVAFFSKTLTVRGYWELEETFAWPE